MICDDCGDHVKSIMHCLWLCDQPHSIWFFDPSFSFLVQKKCKSFVFFPNGSILKAPIHPKCSYVWRSILQAQDVINKGAIWRVGNGELIDVWKHQWLPNLACSKIVSPKANSSVTWVCDLFYPNTRIWDLRKLERCFFAL